MTGPRAVPVASRAIAARLVELLERDRELVAALNAAQRRLHAANARLWDGLHPDALALIYNERPSAADVALEFVAQSSILPPDDRERFDCTAILSALQAVHWTIHRAFLKHEDASDDRRQLAFDLGEANGDLAAAMVDAGFTRPEARTADTNALADGRFQPTLEDR